MPSAAIQKYDAAIKAEKEAWEALKGALPGHPDFEQRLWDSWQQAMSRSDAARKAVLAELGFRNGNLDELT